jgi:hypothetical protein
MDETMDETIDETVDETMDETMDEIVIDIDDSNMKVKYNYIMDVESPVYMDIDSVYINYNPGIDLNTYSNYLPKSIEITNINLDKKEYFYTSLYDGKIDNYDVIRGDNEIVYPTRLNKYPPDPYNNSNINLEMCIIFLSNAINKINIKHKTPIIKCLRREDMVLFDLFTGDIITHKDGFRIFQSINQFTIFHNVDVKTTSQLTIFVPIPIILDNTSGHLNILVIDNNNKTIILYEPLGKQGVTNINKLSKEIRNRFKKIIKFIESDIKKVYPDYKFIKTHDDYDGIQTRSDAHSRKVYNVSERHCIAWCTYLCLFRIFNIHLKTEIPTSFILNSIYNEKFSDEYLNLFIRKFVRMIKEDTDNYQMDTFSASKYGSEFYGYEIVENIEKVNI